MESYVRLENERLIVDWSEYSELHFAGMALEVSTIAIIQMCAYNIYGLAGTTCAR